MESLEGILPKIPMECKVDQDSKRKKKSNLMLGGGRAGESRTPSPGFAPEVSCKFLAGPGRVELPVPVLETGGLPLTDGPTVYLSFFSSICGVCLPQRLQNFFNSNFFSSCLFLEVV